MHPTQKPVDRPDLSPADVLRCAALYVQRHGFHQGDMFADLTTSTPAACAQGAVKMAICGNPHASYTRHDAVLFDETMTVLAGHLDPDFDSWGLDIFGEPAEPQSVVADWNDEDGRTIDQLVTALTEAADDYDTYQQRLDAAHAGTRPATAGGAA
jgi:hypothetical protein